MRKTSQKGETELIEPQNIKLGVPYAVTINFRSVPIPEKYHDDHNCRDRWQVECLRQFFNYFYPYCKYNLFMEISKKGRLHFHGTITFEHYSNVLGFYMKSLNKIDANICIKSIDDSVKWSEYCTKSKHLMELFEVKILFTDLDTPMFKKSKKSDAIKVDDIHLCEEDYDTEDN